MPFFSCVANYNKIIMTRAWNWNWTWQVIEKKEKKKKKKKKTRVLNELCGCARVIPTCSSFLVITLEAWLLRLQVLGKRIQEDAYYSVSKMTKSKGIGSESWLLSYQCGIIGAIGRFSRSLGTESDLLVIVFFFVIFMLLPQMWNFFYVALLVCV